MCSTRAMDGREGERQGEREGREEDEGKGGGGLPAVVLQMAQQQMRYIQLVCVRGISPD